MASHQPHQAYHVSEPNSGSFPHGREFSTTFTPTYNTQGASVPPMRMSKTSESTVSSGKALFLSVALRFVQFLFAMVAFALTVSAKQKVTLQIPIPFNEGVQTVDTNQEVVWSDFKALKFLVAIMVILWLYALVLLLVELAEVIAKKTLLGPKKKYITLAADVLFAFLAFGAACAAAVISSEGACDVGQLSSKFCNKVKAGVVFGFLAWFALIPSLILSILQGMSS